MIMIAQTTNDFIFKLSKMFKKFINLNEWLKSYSLKKKHKIASKYLTIYFQIITLIFCINLSTSIPIFQKTNSIDRINDKSVSKNTIESEFVKQTSTKSSEISKFIKNLILTFDRDSDQQLNFQELSLMLTNETLMKKFEIIFHRKQGTLLQKMISSSIKQEQTSTTNPFKYSTDLKQRENTNLKSKKKSKLFEEFRKEEDKYFIELKKESSNQNMETKIFTYSPHRNFHARKNSS